MLGGNPRRYPCTRRDARIGRSTVTMTGPVSLFTVVSPVFNAARFLPEALDSVAALSSPHEHWVIDGGSDDGTVELLEAREDPSLKWISEPDRGQTHAVNKGLERASGDYIGWLNGDDAYVPDAVDRAIAHLDANPGVMAVYGGVEFTDESWNRIRDYLPPGFSWHRELFVGNYLATEAIIFRRELVSERGMLDEAFADAADYDFFMRLFHNSTVERVPETLLRFRYHSDSKTVSNVWRQHDEALEIRLRWARGPADRAAMRGLDRAQRLILPLITSWPDPHPRRVGRIVNALTTPPGRKDDTG
jgi:glycosyltransferase involved in cell wall biosynthesis